MKKAVLVIDMPERCGLCSVCFSFQLHAFANREYFCTMEHKSVEPCGKPNWCPLKPMPEKVEVFVDEWADGYNTCLENILGN